MKIRILLTVLLLCLTGLPGTAAESRTGTLGAEGEVYLAEVGRVSEIFGDDQRSQGDPLVLALEILRPDQAPQWVQVPESEGVNPDASFFILYEDVSDTVFVVWEGRIGSHPVIQLASFRDGAWSDVHLVSETIWSLKGFPQLAITRESFELEDEDGEMRSVQRTLLHVVWWEETADRDLTLYRPLILEDGHLRAMGDVNVLNDLAGDAVAIDAESPNEELVRHPNLQVGHDGRTILVTFADEASRKLLVLDIGLLPAGLGLLGDDVYDFVLGLGPIDPDQVDVSSIAGTIRSHIVIVGNRYRLNPRAVQRLADEVYSVASESLSEGMTNGTRPDLSSLAGTIRSHIVIVGARLSGETLDRVQPASATSILEVAADRTGASTLGAPGTEAPTLVRMTIASELPVPATGPGTAHVFSSPDGSELVLAWETGEDVEYRKASGGTWSAMRSVELSEELDLTRALELLQQNVQPGL